MPKTYDKKAWLEQKELTKEENLKIIQNIVNNFKEDPEKILEFTLKTQVHYSSDLLPPSKKLQMSLQKNTNFLTESCRITE